MFNTYFKFVSVFLFTVFLLATTMAHSSLLYNHQHVSNVEITYDKHHITIANVSSGRINLLNSTLVFLYKGTVRSIKGNDKLAINTIIKNQMYPVKNSSPILQYSITFKEISREVLLPGHAITLKMENVGTDEPHDFQLLTDPLIPVDVTVSTLPPDYTQVINVCNTSTKAIPLTSVEFLFTFKGKEPTRFWGKPFLDWKIVSHTGNEYIIRGGTPWADDLPTDPKCLNPLTIMFSSSPSTEPPVGPFVFRAAGGIPQKTGILKLSMPSAPVSNLPMPSITLNGMGIEKNVNIGWGESLVINELIPGAYTLSAARVDNKEAYYKADDITINVVENNTVHALFIYDVVPMGALTLYLEQAPGAVNIQFKGALYSVSKTMESGDIINLPADTYHVSVSSNGFTYTVNPNPIRIPQDSRITVVALPAGDPSYPAFVDCNKYPHSKVVVVNDALALSNALTNAAPGDLIHLSEGTYKGNFVINTKSGNADKPITLCGSNEAILIGGSVSKGYGLHLNNVKYWNIAGITVTTVQKGIMLDNSQYIQISGVTVSNIGDEAVHFRKNSAHNRIDQSWIHDTGKRKPGFGEGIYIGSAKSNMINDRSDYNEVINNLIGPGITAENIDIKEYSSHGIIANNMFDGSGLTGENFADSWIDVKGNNYLIQNNSGKTTLLDGFQTHIQVQGWGTNNVFDGNTMQVNAPGYGIRIQSPTSGGQRNIIKCNNTVYNAALGLSNKPCS